MADGLAARHHAGCRGDSGSRFLFKKTMHFTNLTRHIEIGANCYLLEIAGKRIVLDSGMHPKQEGDAAQPDFSLLPDDSVDVIILSHSHQDHSGTLIPP